MTRPDLKAARLALTTRSGGRMTQAKLATVMGLDALSVSRIERGVKAPPVRYEDLLRAYVTLRLPDNWPE